MRRLLVVSAATLLLLAAGPTNSFLTVTPLPDFGPGSRTKPPPPPAAGEFTAAPTPNHDVVAPTGAQSKDASVAPGFFTRNNHGQGDGYLPSSSFQSEADSRAKPGAGLNLSMPLQ